MALDRSPESCNVISNAKHIKTIIQTKIQNATCLQDFPSFNLVTYFSFTRYDPYSNMD